MPANRQGNPNFIDFTLPESQRTTAARASTAVAEAKAAEKPKVPGPNKAATDKDGKETNPPTNTNTSPDNTVAGPTTPKNSRGDVKGTLIDSLNYDLAHACDFVTDLQKNIGVKKLIKSIAKTIREGIRTIKRALGLSDASGTFSSAVSKASSIAEDLNYIRKEYIEPVIEFEKYVLAKLVLIRQMIQWILSLPARILKLLQDCVTKLYKAIANIVKDSIAELNAEEAAGTPAGTTENGLSSIVKDAKSTLAAGKELLKSTLTAVTLAGGIATSATAGLITPVSAGEVKGAQTLITNYEKEQPTIAQSSAPVVTQSKSNGA